MSAAADVSPVGLGCNNFGMTLDLEQSRAVVDAAIEAGITFFDTADVYGMTRSESYLGEILGRRRQDIVLATKFGVRAGELPGGARARDVVRACEASLRRLRTDYLDDYLMHYPSSWMLTRGYPDADVPIAETLEAMNVLVGKGMVRRLGCSNFSLSELREADAEAKRFGIHGFGAVQDELSLLAPAAQRTLLPECQRIEADFVPYFPLASGLLTGKYRAGTAYPAGSRMAFNANGMWAPLFTPENFARVDALTLWAQERGRTLLELAFGWLLSQPGIPSVIAGATSVTQVQQNVAAGRYRLGETEKAEIAALIGIGR
jgi:aryl-alcohol dehydrogenase-like predicted oxidoreductase